MAIIELNGKILDKGIRKKKIRMHEPRANLEFSAFAIRGKVTHAPKLSIVQAFDKKKKKKDKKKEDFYLVLLLLAFQIYTM